jgi:hypothetical protein
MDIINEYKNRFYNLLESTIGDVRPLITEDETVSGSPEFNQIVTNLGLDLEYVDESDSKIKNGNQLFGSNGTDYSFGYDSETKQGNIITSKIDSKLPNNEFKVDGYQGSYFLINGITNTTKIETIKTIVQSVVNGKLDKNLVTKELDVNYPKFYEFYENNNLEGYDAYLSNLEIDLEGGNQVKSIEPSLYFMSKNPDNRVKRITVNDNGVQASYGGTAFKKEYVLDGNKISFEKDRKSTKPTGRYKSDSLYDLADTDKYVKKGMKGEIVKQIQHKLLKSGQLKNTYKLAVDNQKCIEDYTFCHGTFGNITLAAVKEFQDANDLVIDGFVGPDTAEALRNV